MLLSTMSRIYIQGRVPHTWLTSYEAVHGSSAFQRVFNVWGMRARCERATLNRFIDCVDGFSRWQGDDESVLFHLPCFFFFSFFFES